MRFMFDGGIIRKNVSIEESLFLISFLFLLVINFETEDNQLIIIDLLNFA